MSCRADDEAISKLGARAAVKRTQRRSRREAARADSLDRLLVQLEDEIFNVCKGPAPPARLFHYTTETGLVGILGQLEFRVTHFTGTNDGDEIQVADPIFIDVFNRRLSEFDEPHVNAMLTGLIRQYRDLSAAKYLDVHIGCLSEAGDLASQWRDYADEGRGYCLEFDLTQLAAMHSRLELTPEQAAVAQQSSDPPAALDVVPVIYRPVRQSALVQRAVDVAIALLRQNVAAASEDEARRLTRRASVALVRTAAALSCQFKKLRWASELEWRTTLISARGKLRPPVTIPFRDLANPTRTPLRSVVVGPAGKGLATVREQLAALRHDGVPVSRSNVIHAACLK
jgi:hypothetical protein